ncbi:kinase-like protein [Pyrenochaeta sp. DS3sAY3a]|nr:kinase-like protein [Pyrenochaeta sp. DS3sAY3a]
MASSRALYTTIRELGAGHQGAQNCGVWLVKAKRSGTCFIEKRVGPRAIQSGKSIREVKALMQLRRHPNIVEVRDVDFDYSVTRHGSIFMQHCELGSLEAMIDRYDKKRKVLEDEGFLYKVFWDISVALCYMATGQNHMSLLTYAKEGREVPTKKGWNAILHRDMKPGNIFLTEVDKENLEFNQYPRLIVGDFGCSVSQVDVRDGRAGATYHSGVTPCFAPPEAPRYNETGDVYTLGLIMNCVARMRNMPTTDRATLDQDPLRGMFRDVPLTMGVRKCLRVHPADRIPVTVLPSKLWDSYQSWRRARGMDGQKLPSWAF